MFRSLGIMIVVLGMCTAGTALAQDTGRVGVVLGYPASIGVVWQASGRVAVRPQVTINGSWGDSTPTTTTAPSSGFTISGWATSVGAAAIFYVGDRAGLRTYVAPAVSYGWSSSTTESGQSRSENTSSAYLLSGSLGAEYALGKRCAVFGELGLAYTRQDSELRLATAGSDSTTHTIGVRSAIGVILYFK
jgi:hypothetical protein